MQIREIIRNSYWGRLFRKDKWLFGVIAFFFAGTVFANIIRLGTTPFFIWAVYSHSLPPRPSYKFYEINYNDNQVLNWPHTWDQHRRMLLYNPLAFYIDVRVKDNGYYPMWDYLRKSWMVRHPEFGPLLPELMNNPSDFDAFPAWFKKYLSIQTGEVIRQASVIQKEVGFGLDGRVFPLASDTLLIIR